MRSLVVLLVAAGAAMLIGASIAFAQDGADATLEDVEAAFGDLTRSEIEAMGYVADPFCIDAAELPPPVLDALNLTASAAMGVHAVREELFDDTVDPLEPEAILLGPNDEVWGVEYETNADTADPTVLGEEMPFLEGGHPGMEFDHYAMHAWFIDNPAGQFADFNPSVSCPAVEAPPATGTGGYVTSDGGSGTTAFTMLLGIAGATFAIAGWTLRRVAAR